MIDIGLTNALAQIRDALYEINDTLASRGGADMICKYRDAENGVCSLHSDLSYPLLEYCVEGPCSDEVLICNKRDRRYHKCENCPYKTYYEQGYV